MANLRWSKTTPEQRSAIMSEVAKHERPNAQGKKKNRRKPANTS
jgi:predicted Fe-S protein YdhL (DUF1289 family)